MAALPPSRPIFRNSRQRARRCASSGARFLVVSLLMLGVGVIVVLLVSLLVGALVS